MNNTKETFTLEQYEIFSIQGENKIIIFPDVPFWIAVTEQGFSALEEMKKTGNFEKVSLKVLGNGDTESIDKIIQFFKPLLDSNILFKGVKQELPRPDLKPNKITFLQTMRCNLRCRHCCVANMPANELKSMSLETAKKVLKRCISIMDAGPKGVSFLGGEPLCGEGFLELLGYASDLGFQIGLSTNGLLIDEKFAQLAAEKNINVQISLDGTDKESHEYVRGQNTWENTLKSIKLLKDYGVDMQTNLVYHRGNVDKLEEYFDFALKYKIKKVRLISLMNMGRAVGQMERVPLDEFVDIMHDLIKRRPDIIDILDETSFMGLIMGAKFSQKMVSCGAGVITLTISPDGGIYPCLNLYDEKFKICNVLDDNFEVTFNNSPVKQHFQKLSINNMNEICKACNMKYFCGGRCRGETFQETGDVSSPYPYCDEWKKAMEKIFWILTENSQLGERKYQEIVSKSESYLNFWH